VIGTHPRRDWLWLAALTVSLIAVNVWLMRAAGIDLHYDEAKQYRIAAFIR
jgi:hypothetical protein